MRSTEIGHPEGPPPAEPEAPAELSLAGEFPAATRDQWRELVAGVLRKAGRTELPDPVEEALRRTVATGVTVAPLYTAEDAGDLPAAGGVPGVTGPRPRAPCPGRSGCPACRRSSGAPGRARPA